MAGVKSVLSWFAGNLEGDGECYYDWDKGGGVVDKFDPRDLLSTDPDRVRTALKNITREDYSRALGPLTESYRDFSPELKLAALSLLKNFPPIQIKDFILDHLLSEESPKVVASIARHFHRHLPWELVGPFTAFLARQLRNSDFRVVANAIEGLGEMKPPQWTKFVKPHLKSDNHRIRLAAALALFENSPNEIMEFILAHYFDDRLAFQLSAIHGMKVVGGKAMEKLLLRGLEFPIMEVRIKALEALCAIASDKGLERCEKFLSHPDLHLRLTAIRGCASLGDRRAIPLLVPYLQSPNPWIRRQSTEALKTLSGRECQNFLAHVDVLSFLERVEPFNQLSREALERLSARLEVRHLKAGELLFELHHQPQKAWVVKGGVIKHFYPVGLSRQRLLGYYRINDLLGDAQIIADLPHYESIAVAETDCELLAIGAVDFRNLLTQNPLMAGVLYRRFALKVTESFQSRRPNPRQSRLILIGGGLSHFARMGMVDELALALENEVKKCRTIIIEWLKGQDEFRLYWQCTREVSDSLRPHLESFVVFEDPVFHFRTDHLSRVLQVILEKFDFAILSFGKIEGIPLFRALNFADSVIVLFDPEENKDFLVAAEKIRFFLAGLERERGHPVALAFGTSNTLLENPKRVSEWERGLQQPIEFFLAEKSRLRRADFRGGTLKINSQGSCPHGSNIRRLSRTICGRRVGVALSGFNAFALAQLGILRVLEREGIEIDLVSGSSLGGIIGALYCGGKGVEAVCGRLKKSLTASPFSALGQTAVDPLSSPLFRRDFRRQWLEELFEGRTFAELQIPFSTQCFDIESRTLITLKSGELVAAFMQSALLPLMAGLSAKGGEIPAVDGGLFNPVPAEPLIRDGANILLATDLFSTKGPLPASGGLGIHVATLMSLQTRILDNSVILADIVFSPDLSPFSPFDFLRFDEITRAGEVAAEAQLDRLRGVVGG